MKPKTLLFLQSLAHGLQMINVAVAGSTHTPVAISIGVAACCASLGYFLQNVGNATIPSNAPLLDPEVKQVAVVAAEKQVQEILNARVKEVEKQ